jgi:AGCS family alanine or glycine:cation symporter
MPRSGLFARFLPVILSWLALGCLPAGAGVSEVVNQALAPVAQTANDIVFFTLPVGPGLPVILLVLGGTAVFLTVYFRFINLRGFGIAVRTARGRYTPPDAPGQITHFQALSAALSATVGLGNIAGVAVAVGIGGPGATFWMILMGLCGMTTKYAECTLGVKYRRIDAHGRVHGGAMYYLLDGLRDRKFHSLAAVLAVLFAVFVVFGSFGAGNMFQANQATDQLRQAWLPGVPKWGIGLGMAILAGVTILGGIVSIGRVTSFLVPFMCAGYVLTCLLILALHAGDLPAACAAIVGGAFTAPAVSGGLVGVLIQGIKRAAFSNEAGLGSAPIAHAAVKTYKPASEGFVALLEPFVDTVVVCTMTAMVLVVTGTWKASGEIHASGAELHSTPGTAEVVRRLEPGQLIQTREATGEHVEVIGLVDRTSFDAEAVNGWVRKDSFRSLSGIPTTSLAFQGVIAWYPKLLAVAVFLFAFSTMISWSYYGEQGVRFLFRRGPEEGAVVVYKIVFCALTVLGATASLDHVIALTDAMVFAMVLPNLIGLYFLLPVIRRETDDFLAHVRAVDGR